LGINFEYLKQLTEKTGGIFVPIERAEELLKQLELKPKFIRIQEELEIWYKPVLLLLIIACITLEWILRKRFGLV
jgi:hypothetical protein